MIIYYNWDRASAARIPSYISTHIVRTKTRNKYEPLLHRQFIAYILADWCLILAPFSMRSMPLFVVEKLDRFQFEIVSTFCVSLSDNTIAVMFTWGNSSQWADAECSCRCVDFFVDMDLSIYCDIHFIVFYLFLTKKKTDHFPCMRSIWVSHSERSPRYLYSSVLNWNTRTTDRVRVGFTASLFLWIILMFCFIWKTNWIFCIVILIQFFRWLTKSIWVFVFVSFFVLAPEWLALFVINHIYFRKLNARFEILKKRTTKKEWIWIWKKQKHKYDCLTCFPVITCFHRLILTFMHN